MIPAWQAKYVLDIHKDIMVLHKDINIFIKDAVDSALEHSNVITDALPTMPSVIIEPHRRLSFRSFFAVHCTASENIQLGLFKIFFKDRMFCVGIAEARMNHFKGSLYDFATVFQGSLRQHTFQISQSVQRTVVGKTFNSSSSPMLRPRFLA